jgi:hypothetical protein
MKIAGGPHPLPDPPFEGEGRWMLTFPLKGRESLSNEFNGLMWYFQVKFLESSRPPVNHEQNISRNMVRRIKIK